jgi:multisubunit Na+/H+ antiporter MnhC subunit
MFVSRYRLAVLIGLILFSSSFASIFASAGYQTKMLTTSSPTFPVDPNGSWNPLVPCSSPAIVRITDITDNMTGQTSYNNSPFAPGITLPAGFIDNANDGGAKRWLTSGNSTLHPPSGWKSPGPGCTITNSKGQIVASFVEIDGVKRTSFSLVPGVSGDCDDYNNTNSYDPVNGGGPMGAQYCDTTFNIYDPTIVANPDTCANSTVPVPACYGIIHVEIDHDWKARGYCPSTSQGWSCNANVLYSDTTTSTLLDVQGFIYWDTNHTSTGGTNDCPVCEPQHSFSGWELHPFTAWRIHPSPTEVSCSPPSVAVGSPTICAATVVGTNPTGTISWQSNESGTFSSDSCSLLSSGSCQVTYTPSSTMSPVMINASYSGDANNGQGSGTFDLTVVSRSSVSLTCSPNPVTLGSSTICKSSVSGSSPTGVVSFSSTDTGAIFSPSNGECALSTSGSCQVSYKPSMVGSAALRVSYPGDSGNSNGSASLNLEVIPSVLVSCSPSTVSVGSSTTCTASVNGQNQNGTISWQTSGSGTFSSNTCSLSSNSCHVTYTPSGKSLTNITASYGGDTPSSGTVELTVTENNYVLPLNDWILVIAAIVVTVATTAVFFITRRR